MISEADYENLRNFRRDRTRRVWSFSVALPVALLLWMLLTWRLVVHLSGVGERPHPDEIIRLDSSVIAIHHVRAAVPKSHPAPPKPQPKRAAVKEPIPHPQAQPTEIARIDRHAPPQPRSAPQRTRAASLAEQLAQQQSAFTREAQQLNDGRTLAVATADPGLHDTANTAYKSDFSGTRLLEGKGEGFMDPVRRWIDSGLHCYYGRYLWIYPTGGTERAVVPWPLCFTPSRDPFSRGERQFPFPMPPPGYRIPAGTDLAPIEKDVYEAFLDAGG